MQLQRLWVQLPGLRPRQVQLFPARPALHEVVLLRQDATAEPPTRKLTSHATNLSANHDGA